MYKFTSEHFEDVFCWPVFLMIVGVLGMLISFLVPRLEARLRLRAKE